MLVIQPNLHNMEQGIFLDLPLQITLSIVSNHLRDYVSAKSIELVLESELDRSNEP